MADDFAPTGAEGMANFTGSKPAPAEVPSIALSTTSYRGPRGKEMRVIRDWREALATIRDDEEVALDLETGGLNPATDPLAVVSLFGTVTRVPAVLHFRGRLPDEVRAWLSRPGARWITHNGPCFDLPFMAMSGVDVFASRWYCTMLAEQVTVVANRRNVRVNLAKTAERRTGKRLRKDQGTSNWMAPELDAEQVGYCVGDVMLLPEIKEKQLKKLTEEGRLRALEVELDLSRVVTKMVLNGLPLSLNALMEWREAAIRGIQDADERLTMAMGAGANFNSPVQVLKHVQVLDPEVSSTNKDYMLEYIDQAAEEDPVRRIFEDIIVWRQGKKRDGMYDDEWVRKYMWSDGRIHARFWQVGTETGRFSSSDPNLQQIPRDGRKVFGHQPGHKVVASDYSSIEVVVAAILANDENLIADCRMGDPHMSLAMFMSGKPADQVPAELRRMAKAGNFTLLFCGGVPRFFQAAKRGGAPLTMEDARRFVDRYLARYRGIDRMRNMAFQKSRSVHVRLDFPTGLRRDLGGAEIRPTIIVNNLVQGTAAAGIKLAMIEADRRDLTKYLGAAVHDELVATVPDAEVPDYVRELEECMIGGMLKAFEMIRCRTDAPVSVSTSVNDYWSK